LEEYNFVREKKEEGFWGVTEKEGRGFLKIKFYERVILSF
jgi:hypothetical protein